MTTSKLKQWADSVKIRDGQCMHCGCKDDLHAHHIKPKSSNPELSLIIENGETLCYRCHKKEHEKMRSVRVRSNTPQRRTLIRKISELENDILVALKENKRLSLLVGECNRGCCQSSIKRKKWFPSL